jgi:Zn-dependent protease with chaperone function
MATDFFERQSTARRNTKWLVVVFALAVIGIVGTTVAVAGVAVYYGEQYNRTTAFDQRARPRRYPVEIPLWAGAASLALIGGGSLFKIAQLAGGGTTVAERLGGRRLFPDSLDPTERRLLNVVEEMALASGVPVPPVFLLNKEQGINAFAAGFSPSDAVIGVTRGCAEQLSRDQLQGVIAHEFSHILNGDMRLNLRLIGVLHGILLLGLVGRELMYWAGRGGGSSRRGGGVMYLLLIGLALLVLGFLGSFFGNFIKAAVSRQREFLADASAVQFTRNPGGLAGALKRIGAAVFGSRLNSPHAAEASHMYFSQGVRELFATHPPLANRIRRLDPQWDGKFPRPRPADMAAAVAADEAAGLVAAGSSVYDLPVQVAAVRRAAEQVGNPGEIHRQYAAELVAAMPRPVVDAAREPYGARAVIYATLLDRNEAIRANQLRALERYAQKDVYDLTRKLIPWIDQLDVRARLPLVDMAMPALRAISASQYRVFSQCFGELVQADQRIGLFEWTLHQILLRHLRPQFEKVRPPQILYYGLQRLGEPCSVLLSTLARASQSDDRVAFDSGARRLADVPVELLPAERCKLSTLQESLKQLSQVAAKQRQRLVDACAATICADQAVNVAEAELLRAICDMLDCPMPPLLPGQPVPVGRFVSSV